MPFLIKRLFLKYLNICKAELMQFRHELALQISIRSCPRVYSQDVEKAFSFFPSPLLGVCPFVFLE